MAAIADQRRSSRRRHDDKKRAPFGALFGARARPGDAYPCFLAEADADILRDAVAVQQQQRVLLRRFGDLPAACLRRLLAGRCTGCWSIDTRTSPRARPDCIGGLPSSIPVITTPCTSRPMSQLAAQLARQRGEMHAQRFGLCRLALPAARRLAEATCGFSGARRALASSSVVWPLRHTVTVAVGVRRAVEATSRGRSRNLLHLGRR